MAGRPVFAAGFAGNSKRGALLIALYHPQEYSEGAVRRSSVAGLNRGGGAPLPGSVVRQALRTRRQGVTMFTT